MVVNVILMSEHKVSNAFTVRSLVVDEERIKQNINTVPLLTLKTSFIIHLVKIYKILF